MSSIYCYNVPVDIENVYICGILVSQQTEVNSDELEQEVH